MRKGFFVCLLSVCCVAATYAQDIQIPSLVPIQNNEPIIDDPVKIIPKTSEGDPAETLPAPCPPAAPIVAAPVVEAPPIIIADPPAEPVFWVSGEYLLWMMDDAPLPQPLATVGSVASQGIIGAPGTQVGIGNTDADFGLFSGFRLSCGMWASALPNLGFEASGFFTEQRSESFRTGPPSAAVPVIARPIIDVLTGTENASLVALPGAFTGTVDVTATARLWGGEISSALRLWANDNLTVDGLAGFRYLELEEALLITESTSVLGGGAANFNGAGIGAGSALNVVDHFEMRNQFFGGQMGGRIRYNFGRLGIGLIGKVALGNMRHISNVSGTTTATGVGPAPATVAGGLLAVGSNSGRQTQNSFAVIPEVGINLNLRVSDRITLFGGYSFLYVDNVIRPGDQVDRGVNTTLVPTGAGFGTAVGPARPAPLFNQSDFYAHGANFGLRIVFGPGRADGI